eukprot:365014-Chlamydomonas_euryale.AAC.9
MPRTRTARAQVAVLAKTGEYLIIDSGPLPEAVAASAAIPVVFSPVRVPSLTKVQNPCQVCGAAAIGCRTLSRAELGWARTVASSASDALTQTTSHRSPHTGHLKQSCNHLLSGNHNCQHGTSTAKIVERCPMDEASTARVHVHVRLCMHGAAQQPALAWLHVCMPNDTLQPLTVSWHGAAARTGASWTVSA